MTYNKPNVKIGKVIEYIEHRKIVCAVVLKMDERKLKILVESNREVKLSINRISHEGSVCLDLSIGKIQLVKLIRGISLKRKKIADTINVEFLWNKVVENKEWLEVKSISKLCFLKREIGEDEEAAVIRACFNNKVYFKFKPTVFFPNSKEKINKLSTEIKKLDQEITLINKCSEQIRKIIDDNFSLNNIVNILPHHLKKILSSFYIHGKISPYYKLGKKILNRAKLNSNEDLFNFMVQTGTWNIDENLDIFRFKVPTYFSQEEIIKAKKLENDFNTKIKLNKRTDFTDKFTITIDGSGSLDFDDALSIEQKGSNYIIGIHISDVSHYVKKGDTLDQAAFSRICSIYMPDFNIPMIPSNLSENIFSLKKGKRRLSLSTIVELDANAVVINYDICSSVVQVNEQFNYCNVDKAIKNCKEIDMFYDIAKKLREMRIKNGATQIRVPELSVDLKKSEKISSPRLKIINRESPGRMLIEEMMILSNWISAQFLKKHKIPTIFRSQPEPIKRLLKNNSNSLFHNWMQKKMFRKLSLNTYARRHCILGLDSYVTSTSPIRKYSDLVTQRQIKNIIKTGKEGYSENEISEIIKIIVKKTILISKIQSLRTRYWILKYLEQQVGKKEDAIVLHKRYKVYNILIKTYMLECVLQQSTGIALKPKDIIQITIQHVSARNNTISVFMA